MYYEEKEIDGTLHYRNSPDGLWVIFGIPQYKNLVNRLMCRIESLDSAIMFLEADQSVDDEIDSKRNKLYEAKKIIAWTLDHYK